MKNQYRVDKETISKEWGLIILILFLFILGTILYPKLPDKVPSHWNVKGEVDQYSSRFWGAFGIPMMISLIYLGLLYMPYIDPKRQNYVKFESTYRLIRFLFVIVFAVLQIILLTVIISGRDYLVSKLIPSLIGIMFIIMGNYLPRVKHNWFVGIKTPWTLSNEEVWKRTHRFSGYLFVIGGLIMFLAGFLPSPLNFIIGIGGISSVGIISIIYSFFVFRKITKN